MHKKKSKKGRKSDLASLPAVKVWLVAAVIRKELAAKLAITLAFNISGNTNMCIWKTHVKSGAFSFESFFNLYFVQQLQCNGGKTDIFRMIVTCLWRSGVCSIKYIYSDRDMGFGIVQIKVCNLLQLYIFGRKENCIGHFDLGFWTYFFHLWAI